MSTVQKFLFLYRNPYTTDAYEPSPEEMQGMLQAWGQWKASFNEEIVDMGDALKSAGGAVLKGGEISDGPFVEAKEVLGGYSIVHAASLKRALEIAKKCPITEMPGASIEIRELAGY
jgi:hypothetical protein